MPEIVYIDPVGPEAACPDIISRLDGIKNKDTKIYYSHLETGPSNLEYRYSEALVIPDLLNKIIKMEREGYDGVIIGCFYDPGLYEAKEVLQQMTVTAPAEASLYIASTFGHSFSILVGQKKWIPRVTENLRKYGLEGKLASFKSLNMGVDDFQDNDSTVEIMKEKSQEAVEKDGAEVIILGCTMLYRYSKILQEITGVPVIDPVIAAFKYAEFLIDLREKTDLYVSQKYAFESPPVIKAERNPG